MNRNKLVGAFAKHLMVLAGISLGSMVWIVDPAVDYLFFHDGPFLEQLLSPEPVEIYFRISVSGLLFLFGLFAQIIINKQRRTEEQLRKHRDHLDKIVEERTVHLSETVNTLAQEVNERKKAEAELRKSRDYLRAVTRSIHDGLLVIEKDYTVSFANEAIVRQSGLKMEKIIGQPCYSVSHQHDQKCHGKENECRLETVYKTKQPQIVMHQHSDNNGNRKWVEVCLSPMFDEKGEVVRVVELVRDISQRKRLEQEILRAEKLASIGRLTSGACHEILNPLNIISMRFHMMVNDPKTPPEVARQINVLSAQIERIYKITRGLLYFSRQQTPEHKVLNLNDEIRRVLSLMEHELELRNIEVGLNLCDELKPIHADPNQLQQVILNLTTNALDAMPDGGRIDICTSSATKDGQDQAVIRVEDTGVGIAPDHLGKLFDPFFSTKDEGKGTGLGLAVCHGIIEAHGGSIQVESEEGVGTIFTVHMPLNMASVPSGQTAQIESRT